MGPNLTNGSTVRQFPNAADQVDFCRAGSENGKRYGQQGQGRAACPASASCSPRSRSQAIVAYERGL